MGEEHPPDFSPDGKRIVFVSSRDGNWELCSIGTAGRHERRLTGTPDVDENAPRFGRHGKRILYAHDGRLAHMTATRSDVRELGLPRRPTGGSRFAGVARSTRPDRINGVHSSRSPRPVRRAALYHRIHGF
jgi:Tol biopolymer transport system component